MNTSIGLNTYLLAIAFEAAMPDTLLVAILMTSSVCAGLTWLTKSQARPKSLAWDWPGRGRI